MGVEAIHLAAEAIRMDAEAICMAAEAIRLAAEAIGILFPVIIPPQLKLLVPAKCLRCLWALQQETIIGIFFYFFFLLTFFSFFSYFSFFLPCHILFSKKGLS